MAAFIFHKIVSRQWLCGGYRQHRSWSLRVSAIPILRMVVQYVALPSSFDTYPFSNICYPQVTFTLQRNLPSYSNEYIYSTHESLVGFRGVYNFGAQQRIKDPSISSRLTIGGEIYYSILAKSPGLSAALRYTAQSAYTGTPLTMALMCNPLMGHLAAMYSLTAGGHSFGSRIEFNVYSYESDLSVGCELWRSQEKEEETTPIFSTIKASTSLKTRSLNMLWEGRFKDLLVSTGVGLTALPSQTLELSQLGVSIQYSS